MLVKSYKNNGFIPDSLISMSDGSVKYIKDVKVDDKIINHKGNIEKVLKNNNYLYDGNLININIRGKLNLNCTIGYGFYVLDVSKFDGRKDDTQKHIFRLKSSNKKFIFKKTSELKKYDLLTSVSLNKKINSDLNMDKARLLGLFAAEGCFVKKHNIYQGILFTFNINEYENLALKVKNLLNKEFNVSANIYKHPDKGVCEVIGFNKKIADFFKYHVGEYSKYKTLSEELIFANDEIKKHFISGWLDGDGCVEKKFGQIIGVSTSKNLINCISLMLNSIKIGHGISKVKGQKNVIINKKYPAYNGTDYYRLTINATEGKQLIKISNRIKFKNKGQEKKQNNNYKDYMLHSVSKIDKKYYKGIVYNLKIKNDNSYMVNGIVVQNCDI